MPTRKEREYYAQGFRDGRRYEKVEFYGDPEELLSKGAARIEKGTYAPRETAYGVKGIGGTFRVKPKRKLSAWNKFVRANSKKKIFRYRDGKLNLKKMGIAFRKTPAGKKKR